MVAAGADILDIGGASSHPRAKPIPPHTELERVQASVKQLAQQLPIPISIDTQTPLVAEHCLRLGARIINDVSGFAQPQMAELAAQYQAPLVLTYNNLHHPLPPQHQHDPQQLLDHMLAFFQKTIAQAKAVGATQLLLDPGYGFGKTPQQNLQVLNAIPQLLNLGLPLLVCTSRKASLASLTKNAPPKSRLGASIASGLHAASKGAHLLRVHDVLQHRQALTLQHRLHQPFSKHPYTKVTMTHISTMKTN